MTLDEFDLYVEEHPLTLNHFDPDAAYDGYMFDTEGEEFEFVKAQPEEKVFTLVSVNCGCGRTFCDCPDREVVEGLHDGDQLGYFILESK